jgi:hypothetical protein
MGNGCGDCLRGGEGRGVRSGGLWRRACFITHYRPRFPPSLARLGLTRSLTAGSSEAVAESCAGCSYRLFRTSMKIRAAPRDLLLAACILSPPYFGTVLTRSDEPGDGRVLENPRFIMRQGRYSRAHATYGDDKDRPREHLALQLTIAPARRNQAPQLGQRSGADSKLTASHFCGPLFTAPTDVVSGLARDAHDCKTFGWTCLDGSIMHRRVAPLRQMQAVLQLVRS